MENDASFECGKPQRRDEELPDDDGSDHPAGRHALVDQHDQYGEHEDLVGCRIEERAERGGVATTARDASVEPVRGHRGCKDGRRPVVVTGEVPRVEQDDERNGGGARDSQAVREAHSRNNRGAVAVFSKVLVANRGEIAVRVFRTLRELGIGTIAVYSEVDRNAAHVAYAAEAHLIGPGPPVESYLNHERVLDAARRAGADAIHPGYGFLAENADFARVCGERGFVWIGPPPEAIEAMGSKIEARERMQAAGVPIIPGVTRPVESAEEVRRLGDELGWPIAVKASAGGGGKGLKVVRDPAQVERAFASARREGEAYFSDPAVYVERYLEDPRHVEVQVLADAHGNVIHLGERDCTIQRRHQKLVEETPSPAVDSNLRERIGAIAIEAARAVGYRGAGTIEGLLSREGEYFCAASTRRTSPAASFPPRGRSRVTKSPAVRAFGSTPASSPEARSLRSMTR